jgi:hypothetical protein
MPSRTIVPTTTLKWHVPRTHNRLWPRRKKSWRRGIRPQSVLVGPYSYKRNSCKEGRSTSTPASTIWLKAGQRWVLCRNSRAKQSRGKGYPSRMNRQVVPTPHWISFRVAKSPFPPPSSLPGQQQLGEGFPWWVIQGWVGPRLLGLSYVLLWINHSHRSTTIIFANSIPSS